MKYHVNAFDHSQSAFIAQSKNKKTRTEYESG